jgi:hypothetical protein
MNINLNESMLSVLFGDIGDAAVQAVVLTKFKIVLSARILTVLAPQKTRHWCQ